MDIVLEMRGINKKFGDVQANKNVDLTVQKGSVHSIVGENGAGKTTLMNILYGLYRADSGEILINGEQVDIKDPLVAIQHGIGMIHQHFKLIPAMTVAENVLLGNEPRKFGVFIDQKKLKEQTRKLSDQYGLAVDPDSMVSDISVGIRQRVEILKVLFRNADLFILDEPTALLTPQETEDLFKIVDHLRKEGKTILFISHKLKEIMQVSDRVTVMRDGCVVNTVERKDTSEVDLARMMVGRDVFLKTAKPSKKIGETILKVENLSAVGEFHHRPVLRNVSFDIKAGEILGVAGIDGNGQSELVRALIGLQKTTDGKISLRGKEITHLPVHEMRNSGIGVIPEDRLQEGLVIDFNVQENLCLGLQRSENFSKNGFLDWKAVSKNAEELVEKYDIRTPSIMQDARLLSGGNQQKIIVAREIFYAPDVIIASQPTRGLDIAATDFVHEELIRQRDAGKAVFLLSLSLEEVMLLSTRIAVIYKGEIVDIVDIKDATAEGLGLLMLGGSYEHIPA